MAVITPLEAWIRKRTGISNDLKAQDFLKALECYQLDKLNEVIDYVRRKAPFYRQHLACRTDSPLRGFMDIAGLPFTTPADITANPSGFLAVSQDQIARIVTLRTSGSTGEPKRLFFTQEDLELTMDFFHHGMSTLVRPGWRVAVLLPAQKPDSVGDLLVRGLHRMDVETLAYGPVLNPSQAAEAIAAFRPDCLVGIPTHVLALSETPGSASLGRETVQRVLLSTDYCPGSIARRLEAAWGCRVFSHYGMTEMGLGGGVECEALDGYHLREADLFFEVIDHATGRPCPDGVVGEVVFTTLTRRGMPLIRYRTGDIARFVPDPCPCGTVLRRMERVRGRWEGMVSIGAHTLSLPEMDEALFGLAGLLDYRAVVSTGRDGMTQIAIEVHAKEDGGPTGGQVLQALEQVGAIRQGISAAILEPPVVRFSPEGRWTTTGVAKRKIHSVSIDTPIVR